ncbi:ABC transporter substrate-binding protein [Celerinatantimonas sp. MCCC 1A17872]|uniref:ABC transporter substrate-binding protein n=1 Tax=Celerinatantimonas sp. MCCC 1A17872 TaxID=3177514 RepID=UPI0038BE31B4
MFLKKTCSAFILFGFSILSAGICAQTLTVYSAGPKKLSAELIKGFEAKTGAQVSLYQATAGKIMARYMAEKNNPHADVMISSSWGHALSLSQSGDLLSYISPNAKHVPQSLQGPGFVAQGAAALSIAYNTDSKVPVPHRWQDLSQSAYAGQVTMPDPAASGSALTLVEGLVADEGEKAWTLFKELKANQMIIPGANKAALAPVLQGSRSVVFGAVDYVVLGAKAKGEHINVVYPQEGTVLAPRPVMIMKSTQHAKLAKEFVDYVLSRKGQMLVAKQFILPARTDVKALRPGFDELKFLHFDLANAAKDAVKTKNQFAQIMR